MSNNQWGPPPAPYQGQPHQGQPYPGQPSGPALPYAYQPHAAQPPPVQPAYGWGPQFGPAGGPRFGGPGMHPRPPRRRRTGLILGLTLLAAIGVMGAVTIGVLAKSADSPAVTQPAATAPPSEPAPSSEPPSVPDTTETSAATTTAPRPKPTATTPPPPSDRVVVTRNRFYATGVHRSVRCREPAARPSTARNAHSYYLQIKRCLDTAWPRQVRAGRSAFRVPTMITFTGGMTSPCGTSDRGGSFYCRVNETIYMDADVDLASYNRSRQTSSRVFARIWATHTVAHEYGHHLQALTGVLESYSDLRYRAEGFSAKLELNRRMELQASCYANLFLGANKSTYPIRGESHRQWLWAVTQTGDHLNPGGIRDHGSKTSHGYWARRAFNTRNVAACNTFTASPSQVD